MNNEAKLYIEAKKKLKINKLTSFHSYPLYIVIGMISELNNFLDINKDNIKKYYIEKHHQNSLMPLYDISKTKARIEPGAIIRDNVFIHDEAIILMGAVINTKVSIGAKTMIDMNSVIGSGAFSLIPSKDGNCEIK